MNFGRFVNLESFHFTSDSLWFTADEILESHSNIQVVLPPAKEIHLDCSVEFIELFDFQLAAQKCKTWNCFQISNSNGTYPKQFKSLIKLLKALPHLETLHVSLILSQSHFDDDEGPRYVDIDEFTRSAENFDVSPFWGLNSEAKSPSLQHVKLYLTNSQQHIDLIKLFVAHCRRLPHIVDANCCFVGSF